MAAHKRRDYPWRHRRRWLLLGMVVFFCAAVLGLAGLGLNGERAFQKEIETIRAKGEPVTPDDLAKRYPAPPREENAAESYGKAGETLKTVVSSDGYRSYLKKISEAPKQGRFAEELHTWMEGYLTEHAEALRVLHEAAKDLNSRYSFDFSKGITTPIPDLPQLGGSAQLLQLEAYVAVEDGDIGRATEAIIAALAMDRPMREAPNLIMQMIRQTLRSMACSTIKRVLSTAAFSDAQLLQMQNALAETDFPDALANAFIGERASGLWAFDRPLPGASSPGAGLVRLYITASGDRERYLRFMTDLVDASRLPCYEALSVIEGMERDTASRWPFLPGFTDMIIPNLFPCVSQTGRDDALMFGALAALAVERFRLANGAPPGSIEALAPAFLSAVPLDPFDGRPLRYRADGQGYTFYSIGDDRVDDGGVETPNRNSDVVFRVTYPQQ